MRPTTRQAIFWGVLAVSTLALAAGPADTGAGKRLMPDRLGAGREVLASGRDLAPMARLVEREAAAGNLKLVLAEPDVLPGYRHERFAQYHRGVPVFGGQMVRHSRNGEPYLVAGNWYDGIAIDVVPALEADYAARMGRQALGGAGWELVGRPDLAVFPEGNLYRLAWRVTLRRPAEDWTVFVDARTGADVFRLTNLIPDTPVIGIGTGWSGNLKLSTTQLTAGGYRLVDMLRPAVNTTGNDHGLTTINTVTYCDDADNSWTEDKTMVDAHAYLGFVYDYFAQVHNRQGINGHNLPNVIVVHFGNHYANAFFHNGTKWFWFGDNTAGQRPYAAALDVVGHEYTHGVNYFTCNQTYAFEPGALNEAFSDIMGTAVEWKFQAPGTGYGQADWMCAEDANVPLSAGRSLSDPASVRIFPTEPFVYPDHWTKRYNLPFSFDYGGVHINCTIAGHWFYLLANGGTNKTSGQSVTGIGLDAAAKIAFRAWTLYATPNGNFHGIRVFTYNAAVDLYGASSTEAQRVIAAWNAVGVL